MAKSLNRSSATFAGLTFISRILGFVRDIILAQIFGAGAAFDAFVIAFKIPNFFRRLFGEGAFSQAFVPVLSEYCEKQSPQEAKAFVNRIAGTLGLVLLLVVIICELVAPVMVYIFAPGFHDDPHRFLLAKNIVHLTLPYLMLICLTAFSGAILNTFNRFAVPAFTPVLLNVCLIIAAWYVSHFFATPIYALAWGVLIAGIVQLAWQIPFLINIKMLPKLWLGFKDPGVRRVLKLMLPALFGVSVQQISLLIDNFFASFLPAGSISWLYYSDRLTYLPLGVIGVAIATVVLPNLSRQHASGSLEKYRQTLTWAMRTVWFWGLPAALGLIVLAGPLLATLIHRGAFNSYDVIMTQKSLMAFALGLPGFMMIKVLASAFYAKQNIKTPVKIAAVALVVNVILNFILIHPLAHAGLALSSSIASMVNSALLYLMLFKQKIIQFKGFNKCAIGWKIVLAAAVMTVLLYHFSGTTNQWLAMDEWHRVGKLVQMLLLGSASYFICLWITGVRKQDLKH